MKDHSNAALPSNQCPSLHQHSINDFATNFNCHEENLQLTHHLVLQPRNINIDPAFSAQPSLAGSIVALYKQPVQIPDAITLMPISASELQPRLGKISTSSHTTPCSAALVPPAVQPSKLNMPISTVSVSYQPDQLREHGSVLQPSVSAPTLKASLLKTSLYQWGLPKKVVQVRLTSCAFHLSSVLSWTHHPLLGNSIDEHVYSCLDSAVLSCAWVQLLGSSSPSHNTCTLFSPSSCL